MYEMKNGVHGFTFFFFSSVQYFALGLDGFDQTLMTGYLDDFVTHSLKATDMQVSH